MTPRATTEPPVVLVTGATGTVGGELVRRLVADGVRVRVLTRSRAHAGGWGPQVEVVVGDLGQPESLTEAMRGIERVMMVTGVMNARAHDANLVDAARRSGVRHLVKLSALRVEEGEKDAIALMHQEGEELVRCSGMDWTILRPRAFMSNALQWAPAVRAGEPLRLLSPHARHPIVDPQDIAAVAACALTSAGHERQVYRLTGPDSISPAEQLSQLGVAIGRDLHYQEISLEEAREPASHRMPMPLVDALFSGADDAMRTRLYPTIEQVTKKPARAFRDWISVHREYFTRRA